jgi:hypothetical protein
MKNYLFRLVCLFFLLFLFPQPVRALTFTIESDVTTLATPDQEYPLRVTYFISQPDDTVYYLRGVFFKKGSTSYCGYTWNGTNWFKGPYTTNDGWKQFEEIKIAGGSWSGILKSKIDPDDSACKESGTYQFKAQRFTANSSSPSDSQNELTIEVIIPTQTPTPTMTPTPSYTPTPTPIPTPTLSPSSTNSPTLGVTPKQSLKTTISPTNIRISTISGDPTAFQGSVSQDILGAPVVLGESSESTNSQSFSFVQVKPAIISLSFVGIGLAILAVSFAFQIQIKKKQSSDKIV